jgi:hypothetical protein
VASSRLLAIDWFPFDHFSSHLAIFVVFACYQLFSVLSLISRGLQQDRRLLLLCINLVVEMQ